MTSWNTGTKGGSEHYPGDIFPGEDRCGDSSFENQGSDASSLVDDCKQIIRNLEEDSSADWTHGITGQREILKFGSCASGYMPRPGNRLTSQLNAEPAMGRVGPGGLQILLSGSI